MQNGHHIPDQVEPITFACEGKCRICPYPGANCKSQPLSAPTRETDAHRVWMDSSLQDQIMKKYRMK